MSDPDLYSSTFVTFMFIVNSTIGLNAILIYFMRLYLYRATRCGKSRPACLYKKLHPEVHNFLFGVLHLWQFGKLFVQNVRLHD